MVVKVTNSYEAAYYLMNGGKLLNLRTKILDKNRKNKKGFGDLWIMDFEVDKDFHMLWSNWCAIGNIRDFQSSRNKLKRKVRKMLKEI